MMSTTLLAALCLFFVTQGIICETEVAQIGRYPGYSGDQNVTGTILVTSRGNDVSLKGTLIGLEPGVTGGLHIHGGYSCAEHAGVFGHYFEPGEDDPWTTTYTSDAKGVAKIDIPMADFSMFESHPVFGRSMVVHMAGGARVGCGVVGEVHQGSITAFSKYPEYAGDTDVLGSLVVTETDTGIKIEGTLGGLEASATGGIHIHDGFSCTDADTIGGHYDTGLASDPWSTNWVSDANGAATISLDMPGFTLDGSMPVSGRAVVVHDGGGPRAGCGIILPVGSLVDCPAGSVDLGMDGEFVYGVLNHGQATIVDCPSGYEGTARLVCYNSKVSSTQHDCVGTAAPSTTASTIVYVEAQASSATSSLGHSVMIFAIAIAGVLCLH